LETANTLASAELVPSSTLRTRVAAATTAATAGHQRTSVSPSRSTETPAVGQIRLRTWPSTMVERPTMPSTR